MYLIAEPAVVSAEVQFLTAGRDCATGFAGFRD